MDKVVQSNAASAEESASASEELNAQALTLQDSIGGLRELVGGRVPTSGNAKRSAADVIAAKSAQPASSSRRSQTVSPALASVLDGN
jgi:methyl-accepting chemotaxis protein